MPPATPAHPTLESYLEMLAVEKGLSVNTLQAYQKDLLVFANFLTHYPICLEEASLDHIRDFLGYLHDRKLTSRSIARYLSALRQYYRFLIIENIRTDNPTTLLDMPKLHKGLPRTLSEGEIRILLETARYDSTPEGKRLYTLLEVLYATGMRVSELVTLAYSHELRTGKMLLITGKGNKERLVPLNKFAQDALQEYLAIRPYFFTNASSARWVFPSKSRDGHLTRQRFGQLLKDLAVQANIRPDRISPHIIRHAFASHLLHHGADLISIQKMLGHADISTTQIYTHLQHQKFLQEIQEKHPLSKISRA